MIEGYSFFKKRYHDPKTKRLTSLASTIFCDKCFDHFRSDRQLQIHRESCGNESCVIDFPKETEKLQFTKTEYGFKRIYNGYADFESITEKTQNIAECSICKSNESKITCQHSYSVSLSSHKPVSVSFVVIDRNGKMVHEYFYSGEDVIEKFVNEVLELEKKLLDVTKLCEYMIITPEEQLEFDSAEMCYICKNNVGLKGKNYKPFTELDWKVRDHDNISGE